MAQRGGGGGGGGGQQSQNDNSMTPVWIMILLFVTAFLIWKMAHDQIVSFLLSINLLQAKLVNFFIPSNQLSNTIYIMQTINVRSVEWNELMDMMRVVGNYVRYPSGLILVFLGIYLYRSNVTLKFRKIYSMQSLRQQEKENWPQIMAVTKVDLVAQDINEGPWAMAQSPIESARKHALLKKEDPILDGVRSLSQGLTAGIKKGDAKRIFTLQLGPYWEGFEQLSPPAYALCAVFMARINRDRDGADLILQVLDKTIAEGKPNYAIATPVLNKHKQSPLVQEIVSKHAYVLTVLASLLEAARKDGVVPSAEFLWLKPIDRRLWYTLNSIGRQTAFVEVGGVFSHWKAEKKMKRRCLVPMTDEAIKALEIAVKEVKLPASELERLTP